MKFIVQKIFDEGTAEPFFARMMVQIMKIRDFIFPSEKERSKFDKYYEPILNNLIECRIAKINCEKLIEEHNRKIETGEIVFFQEHTIGVKETIDVELNKNFKDFFIKGKIALQSLVKLSKYLGYPISFLLKKDEKFEKESWNFINKYKGQKYKDFVKMLKDNRVSWYTNFNNIRNTIEHQGFNLPKIIYNTDKNGKVIARFPRINSRSLEEVINLFFGSIFEFVEDIIIFLFTFRIKSPVEIVCIPQDKRNNSCPIKYKLTIDASKYSLL